MNILMAGSPSKGVGHWRVRMASKVLEANGHTVMQVNHPVDVGPQQYLTECAEILVKWQPDIVWSGILNRTTISLFRKCREFGVIGRVLDIDDLVHDVPPANLAHRALESKSLGHKKMFNAIMSVTDAVSCTTPFLRDYYHKWRGQSAFVCPNVVDADEIGPSILGPSPDTRLRVGIIYNVNRHMDYVAMMPILRQMVDDGIIHLTCFGSFPEHFWGCSPKDVRWVKHCEPGHFWTALSMATPDVIINRLEPNDFNKAKSNIKWLEATMVGAAFVTTEWGEMAHTPGAWKLVPEALPQGWREVLTALAAEKKDGKLTERVEASREAVMARWATTSTPVIAAYQEVLDYVESNHRDGVTVGGDSNNDIPGDEGERS